MKKITLILSFISFVVAVNAQIVLSDGSHVVVNSGATVIANNGITATDASITNDGIIENKGDLINNTSTLFASGSTGTIVFNGSSPQEITGDFDAGFYGTVEINNTTGVSLTSSSTGNDQTINDTLVLTDGLLSLNSFNLTIETTNPTGASASSYIQTNSTGHVVRNVPADGSTNVTYPIGNSSYNPIILQNSVTATSDDYSVRVQDYEPKNSVGANMVDRSWVVTEATASGSELTVTPQWGSGDELTDFDGSNNAVGLTSDAGTTYNWKTYAAAIGTDPYTQNGFTFKEVGTIAVADKSYVSDNTQVTDITIPNSESDCYNAIYTLYVAGDENILVENGGSATFVAGNRIVFDVGFTAEAGSSIDAHITSSSDYCTSLQAPLVADQSGELEENSEVTVLSDLLLVEEGNDISMYPNPTSGKFCIDFLNHPYKDADIFLLDFTGQKIQDLNTQNRNKIDIDLSYLPKGIYLVVIKDADKVITRKIVKM